VTDCSLASDPLAALRQRGEDYAPGDTDLAWSRATLWRALCASALDPLASTVTAVQVSGEAGSPTRALLSGWLGSRLGLEVELVDTEGGGVTGVVMTLEDGEVRLSRGDDQRTAVMSRTGQPDRTLPLERRALGDLLAEELRRLDPDEVYAGALEAVTGASGLSERTDDRKHEWHDPLESSNPDPALVEQ
jgi:glucose-6-phosphate dehydrogenase assembly protein OpcA